ncbi:MAG: MFS transporter [Comamonadaceae bacterium]|nr:MFS transporter [Comamonadaceae bacterium]
MTRSVFLKKFCNVTRPAKVPWAHAALLAIIYLAFISLGLPDGVLGVAWTTMRLDLNQPLAAVGLLTLMGTVASGLSTLASSHLLQRLGTGPVVMVSGFLTGLALLGYSVAPSLAWLLVLTIPLGLGAGTVDAGLNHFVASHYSSRHMNWLHGCWGVGATLGPLIMGSALLLPHGWTNGYRTIALLQLTLALLLLASLSLWTRQNAKPQAQTDSEAQQALIKPVSALATWLAPLAFFALCVGRDGHWPVGSQHSGGRARCGCGHRRAVGFTLLRCHHGRALWHRAGRQPAGQPAPDPAGSVDRHRWRGGICAAGSAGATGAGRSDVDGAGLRTDLPVDDARDSAALSGTHQRLGDQPAGWFFVHRGCRGAGSLWCAGRHRRAERRDASTGADFADSAGHYRTAEPAKLSRPHATSPPSCTRQSPADSSGASYL